MRAALVIRADHRGVVDLQAPPPLSAKIINGDHGPEVYVVASAASLLEGDELSIAIELANDCQLTVRSIAAQLAHPCPGGGSATMLITAVVGARSLLRWLPEPTIVAQEANLTVHTTVHVARDAMALWQEEYILGRSGEPPSSTRLRTKLTADLDGQPLVRDALDTTRVGAFGPAVLGDTRYVASLATLGFRSAESGAHQLARPGSLRRAMSADVAAGRAALRPAPQELQLCWVASATS